MATKAIYQLFSATKWADLDYLIVDMPPGTGDIHLSVLENYNIDGVYMVTTPQVVSLKDVERAINLYKKFDIEIKGIIENMVSEFFPGNSGEVLSKKYDISLLAKVPLTSGLSHSLDNADSILPLINGFIDISL